MAIAQTMERQTEHGRRISDAASAGAPSNGGSNGSTLCDLKGQPDIASDKLRVVSALRKFPTVTFDELGVDADVLVSTLRRVVEDLEARGFVTIDQAANPKQQELITATAKLFRSDP